MVYLHVKGTTTMKLLQVQLLLYPFVPPVNTEVEAKKKCSVEAIIFIISTEHLLNWEAFCYFRIALINLLLRLSALEFCRDTTAQIAAGIQPIKVICKIKQSSAVKILPLKTKEIHGKNNAISVIILLILVMYRN